jgi:hypothetical protein
MLLNEALMKLEAFLLCDAATDTMGKLNVLGAFDRVFLKAVPALYQGCTVAMRLRFNRSEVGVHRFEIRFVDQDGRDVIKALNGEVEVNFSSDATSGAMNFVLNIVRVTFPYFGDYQVDLQVDGQPMASLPLVVCPIPDNTPKPYNPD